MSARLRRAAETGSLRPSLAHLPSSAQRAESMANAADLARLPLDERIGQAQS